jgi:hypothetical protein
MSNDRASFCKELEEVNARLLEDAVTKHAAEINALKNKNTELIVEPA